MVLGIREDSDLVALETNEIMCERQQNLRKIHLPTDFLSFQFNTETCIYQEP